MALKLGMYHWVREYYQDCSNYDLGLTLTILRQGQIYFLVLVYGKMLEHKISWKLLKILT